MNILFACADASLTRDSAGYRHGGIGVALYSDYIAEERLIHDVSQYIEANTVRLHTLERLAVRAAVREAIRLGIGRTVNVVFLTDSQDAERSWRRAAECYINQRRKLLRILQAQAASVEFQHAERWQVRRAHLLARVAALTCVEGEWAEHTREKLLAMLHQGLREPRPP